ncbi:MAG: hypothetical protein QGG14_11260 [Planctomycetota bacterium]|jgi:tetratricopeptide (TPR) repeat protein|nr:hypothetical protein [Planctomycetota bacterium]
MEAPAEPGEARGLGITAVLLAPTFLLGATWLAWQSDPAALGSALRLVDVVTARLWTVFLFGVLPGIAALLLIYPPAWPTIRLWWKRAGRRLSFDRKEARDLHQRLGEFENARGLESLGELYLNGGQEQFAVGPLIKAVELDPESARSHYLLSRALVRFSKLEDAYASVYRALKLDQDVAFGEAWLHAGEIALKLGFDQDAANAATQHEKRFGTTIRGLYLHARAAHALGDMDERGRALTRLLELPPEQSKTFTPEEALARARTKIARATGRRP